MVISGQFTIHLKGVCPVEQGDFPLPGLFSGVYILQTNSSFPFGFTLPETNIFAPENRGPLEVWRFLLETTISRGELSFREGR